ncbi:MAG TPA: hypothetical protein VFI13_11150 [Gemmatimonadales bacterium]|nr:hypothetical protein [Gemmatimonadales bacterium]
MVSLGQLWIPILAAAVACHLIGFLMWVVMPHHRSDFTPTPDESGLRNLWKGKIAPGLYIVPFGTHETMRNPEMKAKREEGPNAFITVLPNGMGNMGIQQGKNVLFHALVSCFVAYLASATLPIGTDYLKVFQVAGTAAILAYGFTWGHQTIWFGQPFRVSMKYAFDGIVMGLVTAGIFGWLWPR